VRGSLGHCDRCHRLSVLYFPFSETTPHTPKKIWQKNGRRSVLAMSQRRNDLNFRQFYIASISIHFEFPLIDCVNWF
ncbi:hypothetical protein ACE02B_21650, partial [Shewanella mangrovisoli]|uniref:hypothetical protein n=1 Tax=Shewanella mangrovisoli TaxID=2864211 RepID=UPI0035B91C4D